jgi:hypothetical protein
MRRRHFVNALLSSGIAATAAYIIYPILRFVIRRKRRSRQLCPYRSLVQMTCRRTPEEFSDSAQILAFLYARRKANASFLRTMHASELHGPI